MKHDEPIRLVGGTGSPYTQKMVALLRYRRLPYAVNWGIPAEVCEAMGVEKPRPIFEPTFFFEEDGDTHAVCDSTPIIRRLEERVTGRSVLPGDPALAFIDYLIEDFADEWCTKYMFHYRWHAQLDAGNAGTLLPLSMDVSMPKDTHKEFKHFVEERQIGRLYVVGSNDTTAAVIYAPAQLANARAAAARDKTWGAEIDGAQWTQQTFPYQAKCLRWTNERYRALSNEDRASVDALLEDTGVETMLSVD